ncbi:MAG: hypothetical protein ACRDL6_10620 [Solirubrobacterales bacterium]
MFRLKPYLELDRYPQLVLALFFIVGVPGVVVLAVADAGQTAAAIFLGVFAAIGFGLLLALDLRSERQSRRR